MIDPSDLATGVVGGLLHDKIKGAVDTALGDHLPSIAQSSAETVQELKILNSTSSNIGTPDINDYYGNAGNVAAYLVDNYHSREHLLVFSPVSTTLTASIPGLALALPFTLGRGWSTLDLPIGTSFTITAANQYLIVFSNVARGAWLT